MDIQLKKFISVSEISFSEDVSWRVENTRTSKSGKTLIHTIVGGSEDTYHREYIIEFSEDVQAAAPNHKELIAKVFKVLATVREQHRVAAEAAAAAAG